MYYVIQEKIFREENFENLIKALEDAFNIN